MMDEEQNVLQLKTFVSNAKPGDIVKIYVENDNGDCEMQLALVNRQYETSDNEMWVQFFENETNTVLDENNDPFEDDIVVRLSQEISAIPLESLENRWEIDDSSAQTMIDTLKLAGLAPIIPEDADDNFDIVHYELLREIDDDDDIVSSDNEPFTLADHSNSNFVRDMHQAVCDFDSWQPDDAKELAIKTFVENLSGQAEHENEDKRLCHPNVTPIASYKRPPT